MTLTSKDQDPALWVFGYGSLMWNPGFDAIESRHATLPGYQRGFYIYSVHHRGSHDRPGLVLGLDRGGSCEGMAFRVAPEMTAETLAYLRAREQINGVYRETHATIILHGETPRSVFATAFVAERAHPSYAGRLPLEHQAELIRAASGKSGPNIDYLLATLSRLDAMGIQEPALTRLITLIGPHFSKRQGNGQRAPGSRRLTNGIQMAARNTPIRAPRLRPCDRRRFTHRVQLADWNSRSK